MATSSRVACNDTTPTLIFSGVGQVVLYAQANGIRIGGSAVSASEGVELPVSLFSLRVDSPDEIYAITASGNVDVLVFNCR